MRYRDGHDVAHRFHLVEVLTDTNDEYASNQQDASADDELVFARSFQTFEKFTIIEQMHMHMCMHAAWARVVAQALVTARRGG